MNETNATTRLAMMRAVQKLQQANVARVKGAPGIGHSVEQMAAILEAESGYRDLYEALDGLACPGCQNRIGYQGPFIKDGERTPQNKCFHCAAARAALARVRGEQNAG